MEAQGSESSEFWKALGETPTAFVGVSFHQEYTSYMFDDAADTI